jgi:alpha-1,2-glucosyltransferase
MLYIWAFIAFFSVPILCPYALELVESLIPLKLPGRATPKSSQSRGSRHYFILTSYSAAVLAIAVATVYFNTIIHPFTLADNRHYMFYVFRYTILRDPRIKYALIPVYLLSAWFVIRCLGGTRPLPTLRVVPQPPQKVAGSKKPLPQPPKKILITSPSKGADTSFAITWLFSTALCVVTAPLVEPRYFIIPWAIWRLQVPSTVISWTPGSGKVAEKTNNRSEALPRTLYPTLWFETIWFALINVVTGYIFLHKGFEWVQEPGLVQRFMW